ncbi:hypothetical protein ACF08N_14645 [Streptomyces sp. NPDC015127]|uniref:hypothetical protein n=1 Tax=Streptomyces sp. NPDC015127 TaxID=3364939 RepID=UPI0036F8F49D
MDTAAEGLAGGLARVRLRAPAGHEARQYVDVPAKSYSPSAPYSLRDDPAGPSGTFVPGAGVLRHAELVKRNGVTTQAVEIIGRWDTFNQVRTPAAVLAFGLPIALALRSRG